MPTLEPTTAPQEQQQQQSDSSSKMFISTNYNEGLMSKEEYELHYWPKLEQTIGLLLNHKSGDNMPAISYEQMYSCVYKCVCKQFADRLYSDLLSHISGHLRRVSTTLQNLDYPQYVLSFNDALNQYNIALAAIVPIFTYMSRLYVANKLHADLKEELWQVFYKGVAETHVNRLLGMLQLHENDANVFTIIPPAVTANIIKNLHTLNPAFTALAPGLFAKYIPNILPPASESELSKYAADAVAVRECFMQQGLDGGNPSRKRPADEEPNNGDHHAMASNAINLYEDRMQLQ